MFKNHWLCGTMNVDFPRQGRGEKVFMPKCEFLSCFSNRLLSPPAPVKKKDGTMDISATTLEREITDFALRALF